MRNDEVILQTKAVKKNFRWLFFSLVAGLIVLSTTLIYGYLKTLYDLDQNNSVIAQSFQITSILETNTHFRLLGIIIWCLVVSIVAAIMYHKVIKMIDDIEQEHQNLYKFKLIVDHSPNAVFISTAENIIEYSNPQGLMITGYQEAEIIGKEPNQWLAQQENDINYDNIIRTVKTGEVWQGELLKRHRSGRFYWAQTALFPVKSTTGDICNFVTIEHDITQQKQDQDKIRFLANHDELTGLPSLRLGKDRLEQAILASIRHKLTMALMFVDLDGFKQINDQYGHKAGDNVLKEVSQRMICATRITDTIARVGGDEFMVILTNVKQPEAVSRVATKILNCIKEPYLFKDAELIIGASIGIVLCPDQGQTSGVLLRKADKAMYQVKQTGKNNFAYFKEVRPPKTT